MSMERNRNLCYDEVRVTTIDLYRENVHEIIPWESTVKSRFPWVLYRFLSRYTIDSNCLF